MGRGSEGSRGCWPDLDALREFHRAGRLGVGASYDCCPEFRGALANPLLIEEALARHPDMRVDIMHAGYPYIDETIALLHAHLQVYADVTIINGTSA